MACAASGNVNPGSGNNNNGGGGASGGVCKPFEELLCYCPGTAEPGVRTCEADGSAYSACAPCDEGGGGQGAGGGAGGSDPCGDGLCAIDEDCHVCPDDCFCEPCTEAPSCANAQIPPVTLVAKPELNVALEALPPAAILERLEARVARGDAGVRIVAAALSSARATDGVLVKRTRGSLDAHPETKALVAASLALAGLADPEGYATIFPSRDVDLGVEGEPSYTLDAPVGGSESCGAPLLRLRVARITVHEEDDDFANDIVYCAVTTEAAAGAEIRVTPTTPNLDEGDSHNFSIDAGIMWGQIGPRWPEGNMLVTYDCFEQDDGSSYGNLINAIGDAATEVGGAIGGQYGWVFEVVGAVSGVLAESIALDGDDYLFNATQTIDASLHLDLTNGRFWSVRRDGTNVNSDWDWELRVEAWGCAEYGGGGEGGAGGAGGGPPS